MPEHEPPRADAQPARLEFLLNEYSGVQDGIARFDGLRSKVKDWMITVSGGVLVVVFSSKKPAVSWAGVVVVLAFCFTEILYTLTQLQAIRRTEYLESLLNNYMDGQEDGLKDYRFGVSQAFMPDFGPFGALKAINVVVRWRTFSLPLYMVLLIAFLVLALYGKRLGWLS